MQLDISSQGVGVAILAASLIATGDGCRSSTPQPAATGGAASSAVRSTPTTPQPTTSGVASSPPATTSSSAAASSRPSAPTPYPASQAPVSAALAKARRLLAEGKDKEAEEAFVDAAGREEALDLRAVVEHAYMVLRANPDDENLESELLAGTGSKDRELAAQAWYYLALLHAANKRPEAERAALARSLELRDQPVVRAMLAGRTTCLVETDARVVSAQPRVVSGWSGVCSELGLCASGEAVDEAEARKRACVECSGAANEPDKSHGCKGSGPWESSFEYMHFSRSVAWIAPAGGNRFLLSSTREGSWPATCRGSASSTWNKRGAFAHVKQTNDGLCSLRGRDVPQGNPDTGGCLQGPETVSHGVFDLATGKLVAGIGTAPGHEIKVEVDAGNRRVVLRGGHCDGYVPLDGSMRWVAGSPGK